MRIAEAVTSLRTSWLRAQYAGMTDPRAWRRIAYLVLAFPRGIAYFCLAVVGLAIGLGLAVTLLGLPILLCTLLMARALAGWERSLAGTLLDMELRDPHRPVTERTWMGRLQTMVSDPATWKETGYMLLALPLGLLDLAVVCLPLAVIGHLIAAPTYFWAEPIDLGIVTVDTVPEALVLAAIGVVLLPLVFRLAAAFAIVHATAARLLLTSPPDPELTARVVDLQSSRARMVAAADAERRRLERNLHDGAQQRLVALSLNLGMAKGRLAGNEEALELVTRASEEAKLALEELRDLARGIHPVVLSERGLGAALPDVARRAPLPVEVTTIDERLPEAVEVTAYFVVSEALTNVAKYAEATQATVDARLEGGQLVVEVADDGRGGADPEAGTGLRGLMDRVSALEGELTIDSPPGRGTRLRMTLPVAVVDDGSAPVELLPEEAPGPGLDERRAAIVRIRRRRALVGHAAVLEVAQLVLTLIWLLTGRGYFWPVWQMLGWGAVIALHAVFVFTRPPITRAAIEREPGDEVAALKRIRRRRNLATHAGVFVVIKFVLIAIWALAGAGYFWPIWPLLGWSPLLAAHAALVLVHRPITEGDVVRAAGRS